MHGSSDSNSGGENLREIKIGVLGLGVVGSGTVHILQANADEIAQRVGARLVIKKIAVRDLDKPRDVEVDHSLLTTDPYEVIDDPEIDILAELIGGAAEEMDFGLVRQEGTTEGQTLRELLEKERPFHPAQFTEGFIQRAVPAVDAQLLEQHGRQDRAGIPQGRVGQVHRGIQIPRRGTEQLGPPYPERSAQC